MTMWVTKIGYNYNVFCVDARSTSLSEVDLFRSSCFDHRSELAHSLITLSYNYLVLREGEGEGEAA